MTTRIKLRRDTAANWTTNNPVLALGEAGYDSTNNELRIGDGTTAWSGLEAIGGTTNKITAQKTYSDNHSDGSGQTFAYTTGSIAVQMGNNDGLYLNDLLSRWVDYFDGNLAFPYNYSNINLVINPGTDDLASTVTNVISSGSPPLYTITLGTAHAEPITIGDIDFNYTYINTIGLDTTLNGGEGYFGMATGDDDITIRSGRDITLDAADDIFITAGDILDVRLVNRDGNTVSDGIEIITETTASTKTWVFRFDGNLELPEGFSLPTQTNTGYNWNNTLNGPTLKLSNDSQNQVIITGPTTTEATPYSQRIVIQGQRGFGTWSTSTVGEGGDIYIWGGVGGESNTNVGGSGGDVKLRGGQGQNNYGGYVRIEGGNAALWDSTSTGDGGFVEITGGDIEESIGNASRGGDVRITGGRAYSTSTQSGVVQIITGGTINPGVNGDHTWEFGNDGTLTFPDDTVQTTAYPGITTVAKDGPTLPTTTGTVSTLAHDSVLTGLTDATYGPFTLDVVTFSVVVSSGVINTTTNISSTGTSTVNSVIGTIDSGVIGGTTGTTVTWTVASVLQEAPVVIDLTKTINKLTDGEYTLADGVEGQILYLVRQTGSAKDAIRVNVANARIDGILNTTIDHFPFENISDLNMSTLIFTDGAWQASNGGWD